MSKRSTDKIPPALKHGAYSATSVLPGESQTDFENLHQGLVGELNPSGPLEDDIVKSIAHLLWRNQNLRTLRLAEAACGRRDTLTGDDISVYLQGLSAGQSEEDRRAALDEARRELGHLYELTEIGHVATFDGLDQELDIRERLDLAVARSIKQLLMVRGIKSLSADAQLSPPKSIPGPSKAA